MREKLIEYVHGLFRNAPNTQENQDLEAEILQNSLDRFDDLVSRGVPEDSAYKQAVESIGDVRQLLQVEYRPQPKKKHTARNVALIGTAAAVILGLIVAIPAVLFGLNSRGSFRHESLEDRIEREAEHWAEGIEESVEQWVDTMDEEFGYAVILPNSTIGYSDSERYTAGGAEVKTAALEELFIDWMAGTVTVEVWDGDTVSIAETGAQAGAEQVHWLLEDGVLRIHYCAAGRHKALPRKELTVKLPKALAGQLQCLSVVGTSQDTVITGVTAEQLDFDSVSGTLALSGTTERLQMETTSGNCEVKLDNAPDHLEFDSVSGNLTLTIPKEGRGFEVDWDTVSGDFDCEFPGRKDDDEWVFNPEENYALRGEYEFDTVSGDVTIKQG